MKTITKIAVLLLTLLMIVPMLAACGPDDETTTKPKVQVDENAPQVVNMDRHIYKALVRSSNNGNGGFLCEDFYVDPTTGGADAISFAVIERNSKIESLYNCRIEMSPGLLSDMYTEMAGYYETTRFDLAILVTRDAAKCATSGFLSDLKTSNNQKYMDLSDPAFDQNFIEQMTLGNNLYYISGDMNVSSLDNTIATIFNVDLFEMNAEKIVNELEDDMYGDPYQMVKDGVWTMDNLFKMGRVVDHDDDPNDNSRPDADNGDTIGYFQYQASPLYYYYGAGLRITEMNAGYPSFSIDSADAGAMYSYLYSKLNVLKNPHIPDGASSDRARNFQEGSVLFADYLLWDVRKVLHIAPIDFAYGILPIPTYEENAEYHSVVYFQNCHHVWTIPYKRNNSEYAARLMHAFAYYSAEEDSTMDAYYVKTMYMEVARDQGSRDSLDIIRGCMVYDIALLYSDKSSWGNFLNLLLTINSTTQENYDTYTTGDAMMAAEESMQKTIDDFVAMSDGDRG